MDVKFFLLFMPAAYFSYLFHEFGHWTVGEILGNHMLYSMNIVTPEAGYYLHASDDVLVSLGGPGFSVLQSLFALLVIERLRTPYAYPFAFFPMFSRFFSDLLGGFSRQDEARIALLMNAGTYTVAIVVLALLLLIVIRCSYRLNIGPKTNGYILVASTICQLLVIGTYEFFKL
jgi:hypothetical protein